MKKTIAVAVAVLFLLGFTGFTFAQEKKSEAKKTTQEKIEIINGKVVSVDQTKKEVTVKETKSGTDMTFVVSKKAIAVVKVGDEVNVKVKSGSTHAESVKIVKSEAKKQ